MPTLCRVEGLDCRAASCSRHRTRNERSSTEGVKTYVIVFLFVFIVHLCYIVYVYIALRALGLPPVVLLHHAAVLLAVMLVHISGDNSLRRF